MFLERAERFDIPAFQPPPLNAHYEGGYGDRMLEWRRLCAVDKAENIVKLLGSRCDDVKSVLEVGCGTGAVVTKLSSQMGADRFVGIDMADPNAHSDPLARSSGVELIHGRHKRLPFDDNSFDLVFASHVLEHVEDERGFLKEIKRVARNFVYVEVPCELTLRTNANTIQNSLTQLGHINSFTPHSFSLTLATSGLVVLNLQIFDHSEAIHGFDTSRTKGKIKRILRSGMLRIHPGLAAKIFVYHCGALCAAGSSGDSILPVDP